MYRSVVLQELYKKFKKFTILLIIGLYYCLVLNRNAKAMDKNYEIDNVDLKILGLLMQDATMPYTEIGKRIFVSGGTVHVRMRKMEQMGIVRGSTLMIDHTKLGWDIAAFLGIYLDKSSLYAEVAEKLAAIPEVVNIHYTTGIYSIFAKIVCRDTTHLREVLHDKIQKVGGIQRTETFISLEESVSRPVPFAELTNG
ncbi:Lrp/AsnC family transcriptional regulator for asnA, asnC and gidA [Siphonobacter sp. SORGH_AS 1065]|nr:Lrp/AsnC family transcriptional regulator for asnA, asnC and gidA [Siphonobacter sp. SORGH_AS_1065]